MASKKEKSTTILYREINQEIQKNILRPIYLLTGEEDYLIENLCKSIIAKAITPGAEGFDYLKITHAMLANWTPKALAAATKQQPFLSPKRVFHYIDSQWFQGVGNQKEAVLELLETFSPESILIFQESKVDKKQRKLLDMIQKKGVFLQFDYLSANEILPWIRQYSQKLQLQITAEAAYSLASRCQFSMRLIAQEFKKFKLYCDAKGTSEINIAFLDYLSIPDNSGDIFQLTEYLLQKNHQAAFELLKRLKEQNQATLLLIFLIAKHLKQLLYAKQALNSEALATQLKLLPFIAKKLYEQAKRFSTDHLIAYYEACYQADLAIKSGKMNEDLALDFLLTQIH